MSLFTNPIRPAPIASDAAIRRYVEAIRGQIEPDPLYRRRLRGQVVNRFVDQTRGIDRSGRRRPSRMGALARASLYASFALAVSVTGVMAASDAAIPGDILYPVKRGIEQMRLEVLPDEFRDELVVYALSERIDELNQLVEAGDVADASTLAGLIHDAYAQAVAEGGDADGLARRLDRQVARLAQVVSGLPSKARASIEHAMAGVPGLMLDAWDPGGSESVTEPTVSSGPGRGSDQDRGSNQDPGSDQDRGSGQVGGSGQGRGAAGAQDDAPALEHTPKPERTPKPEPTPKDDARGAPDPSPKGQAKGHTPGP
jgi:hypothetical protein